MPNNSKRKRMATDSLPVGNRFSAVWDVSESAFAAAFKGDHTNDAHGSERTITRVQRSRG